MEEVGQMGNAEEAPKANEAFEEDDEFNSSIDEIMSEVDNEEQTVKMAAGGFMSNTYKEGMKFNPVVDVRYFKHADGRVIYITYINDRPLTAIPEGFTQTDTPVEQKVGKEAEDAAAAAAARARTGGGDSGGGSDSGGTTTTTPSGSGQGVSRTTQSIALGALALSKNPVAQFLAPLISAGVGFVAGKALDAQLDAEGRVNQTLEDAANMGYGTRVGVDGNITTFVNDKTLDAFDRETFGVTRGDLDAARAGGGGADAGRGGSPADADPGAGGVGIEGADAGRGGSPADADPGAGGVGTDTGGYSGADTQSSGESYANYKGGFIKKKKNVVVKSKRGLASR
jgi:hypothetical protein